MKHRIEDDSNINEAYLNQDATGDEQQRNPNNNLKYPAKLDKQNSNLRKFSGLTNSTKASDARISSSADLSSDEEKETYGYIYNSEQSKVTPENPEIVVVGLGRYDLEHLQLAVKSDLEEMAKSIEPKSNYPEFGIEKVTHRILQKHSAFIAKLRALEQVLAKMDTPAYKRKITLAKRKRSRYNIKYGDN